jgi:hypothetical protein
MSGRPACLKLPTCLFFRASRPRPHIDSVSVRPILRETNQAPLNLCIHEASLSRLIIFFGHEDENGSF